MNNKERLLGDVLHDENFAAFRAAVLENALDELHRVHRERRRNQLLALAAGVLLTASLCLLIAPRTQPPNPKSMPCSIVRTAPLSKETIVTSTGLAAVLVKTPKEPAQQVFANSGVELIRTDPQYPGAERINDEQLLAALPGERLGLVTLHAGKKQLLLFGPKSEVSFFDEFPKNP